MSTRPQRIAITREEGYIRCCDRPPLVIDCCGCDGPEADKLMPDTWEIVTEPHFSNSWITYYDLDGNLHELEGWKFAWGCENFDDERVRRVKLYSGPALPFPNYGNCYFQTETADVGIGKCCELGCPEEDCATVGHGGPECYRKVLSCYMWCQKYAEIPPIDPLMEWHLDCGCDDLWVGDSSEWGSYEDCTTYDTNCHCSNDDGSWSGDESGCNAIKEYYESLGITCGECEYMEVPGFPGSPGWPAYVDRIAGFGGPCGCGRGYRFLDPNNPACRTMIEDMGSSFIDFSEYQCNGCNTYVLYQYRPEGETNPHCLSCIVDGADSPCQCSGSEFGLALHGYGCCGQPATITVCPASYRDGVEYGSFSKACDVLCCEEGGEVDDVNMDMLSVAQPEMPAIPENSIFWQIEGTSSNGYLLQEEDGKYRGSYFPFRFEVDKEQKTFNGKSINMIDDNVFWGQIFIGGEKGWQITVMA